MIGVLHNRCSQHKVGKWKENSSVHREACGTIEETQHLATMLLQKRENEYRSSSKEKSEVQTK